MAFENATLLKNKKLATIYVRKIIKTATRVIPLKQRHYGQDAVNKPLENKSAENKAEALGCRTQWARLMAMRTQACECAKRHGLCPQLCTNQRCEAFLRCITKPFIRQRFHDLMRTTSVTFVFRICSFAIFVFRKHVAVSLHFGKDVAAAFFFPAM